MAELTDVEKAYNAWHMSRFDDTYKTIRLYSHGKMVHEYTTMNARYSDAEDARCAFEVANMAPEPITCVAVDRKRYKKINGKIHRIANLEVAHD